MSKEIEEHGTEEEIRHLIKRLRSYVRLKSHDYRGWLDRVAETAVKVAEGRAGVLGGGIGTGCKLGGFEIRLAPTGKIDVYDMRPGSEPAVVFTGTCHSDHGWAYETIREFVNPLLDQALILEDLATIE